MIVYVLCALCPFVSVSIFASILREMYSVRREQRENN